MRDTESRLCVVGDNAVRSILERRWLLFFARMNIDFEYEPERMPDGVSNIGYLPDILIHEKLYLEIKPSIKIAREEIRKPYGFVRETGRRLLIVIGDPPGQRILAIIRSENSRITYKDVTGIAWKHLGKKTDTDLAVETASANYAINELDASITTQTHRAIAKIDNSMKQVLKSKRGQGNGGDIFGNHRG